MFFDSRSDNPIASNRPIWEEQIDLTEQPTRVPRKQNPADEWAPPEGARFKARSDHELTMEELHEMEKNSA